MLDDLNFTRDDFSRSKWREIFTNCEGKACNDIGKDFFSAAQQAKEAGDDTLSQVYYLLSNVCNLWLKPEEKYHPFAPIWQGTDGSRSVDISDFSQSHIDKLKEIFDDVDIPELRSRVGDLIWTYEHGGNFSFAEAAVEGYIQAGEGFLFTEKHYIGIERFTRAIHLAASLGKNSGKFNVVIAKIENLVNDNATTHTPFVMLLLNLLYEYRVGNYAQYALIAKSFANVSKGQRAWHFARAYWHSAANWNRLNKQQEQEQICLLEEAECYVLEAEDTLKNSQGMKQSIAAHHLQSAIEALRKVPNTESRQKELHLRMLELQANSRNELEKISRQIDLTPFIEKAIAAVKNKTFAEALFTLCVIGSPSKISSLRDSIENMVSKHPLLCFIVMDVVDENGRVIGHRNSMFSGTPEEIEAAKIAEMHRQARYEQETLAMAINTARMQILQEHTPHIRDFLELTTNNPFVPTGRELIFARGYLYGLQGEYLEALHLLIPQIENSIRYLLRQSGIITSSLSTEGIQEEFDLNTLLYMPELNEIFGDDLVFDLQGVLINRFGLNFRNRMSHGLLEHNDFFSYSAVYIWWILLRICCLPLIISGFESKEVNSNALKKE